MNRRSLLLATAGLAVQGRLLAQPAARATLRVITRQIEVKGRAAQVFGIVGDNGAPGWTGRAGEGFSVRLINTLNESTGIHWHGPTPPWRQDGVPGVSMDPIAPGGSQDYGFPLDRPGTHWMHSHLGLQKQGLLAAPLIVREATARDEQEVVVLLQDFSFTPADELLRRLLGGAGSPHDQVSSVASAAQTNPHAAMGSMGLVDRLRNLLPGRSRTSPMAIDINDFDYDAYLANNRTLDDPEVVPVESGGRVRLRIINGASATGFHLDLGALQGQLIAVDGEPLANALLVSRMPLAVSQRADIVLDIPRSGGALPILFQREGARERTGIILRPPGAAISRLEGETSAAPPLDLALERQMRGIEALPQGAARRISVDLTGEMAAYTWGLGDGRPLLLRRGERVEIQMRNRTMMAHPMHLHGHRFRVVDIGGHRFSGASRDTVLVPPMESVSIAFTADNPGRWPFHCHHLYHQVRGMEILAVYS